MRRLEQNEEVLKLDLVHLSRVRARASQNKDRARKENKKLVDALSTAITIIEQDAYGNGVSKANGART